MIHRSDFPYHELSVEERLLLVEDIWDSIAAERESAPLTTAQQAELDRRLKAFDRNPNGAISWEQVKQRIEELRRTRRSSNRDDAQR